MALNSSPSDKRLVKETLRGQGDKFGLLVERYLPTVYAVAYAQTHNHADAEDVVQEAFMRAYRSLDSLREPRKFEGWVVTIARNAAHGLRDLRKRERKVVQSIDASPSTPPSDMDGDELHKLIRVKIGELEERPREILLLYYFAGKSTREIAQTLSISPDAAKKRLQRARETLSDELLNEIGNAVRPKRSMKDLCGAIVAATTAATVSRGTVAASASTLAGAPLFLLKAAPFVAGLAAISLVTVIAVFLRSESEVDAPLVDTPRERPAILSGEAVEEPGQSAVIEEPVQGTAALDVEDSGDATDESQRAPREPTEEILHKLKGAIGLVMENVHVSEIMEFISETWEIDIVIDDRVVGAASGPKYVIFSTNASKEWIATGYVREKSYLTDGIVPLIDVRDVTLLRIFEEILYPLGLDFVEEPGVIWISSPELIQREIARESQDRYDAYPNYEEFVSQTTAGVVFESTHVSQILEFLSESFDLNISWDYRVIKPPEGSSPTLGPHPVPPSLRPILASASMVTDGMVPYVNLRNIQVRDVLRTALRPLNLAYVIDGNRILITTPARIEAHDLPEMER